MDFRAVVAEELAALMRKDDKIVILDADLSKPNGTSPLYKEFPNRCYNCGIAEANMTSIAAGLSAYGYKPVIFSFAPFVTRRTFDQIAVSCCYAKQNVKIFGTDPGILAEANGGTHMCFEDIAMMRTMPNMIVYDVTDEIQLRQSISQIMNHTGNVYVRLARKSRPVVFDDKYQFTLGKADVVCEGKDISIIASGCEVAEAIVAKDILAKEGINAEVLSLNTVKPLDAETILASVKKTGKAITCENHNKFGGVYSAVCEMLTDKYPMHVGCIAVNDEFGQVGKYAELSKAYKLTADDIVLKVKEELNK